MAVVKMLCVTGKTPEDIRPQVLTLSGPASTSSLCAPTDLATHNLSLYLSSSAKGTMNRDSESQVYARIGVCVCVCRGWGSEELMGTSHVCVCV